MKLSLIILLLVSTFSLSSNNIKEAKHGLEPTINQLKLADAYALNLDQTLSYQIAWAKELELLAYDYLEENAPQAIDHDNLENRLVYIRHFFIPLEQRISPKDLHKKQAWVDSLFQQLKANQSISYFEDLIEKYSEIKEPYWCHYLDETTEFQNEIEQLGLNLISEPFFTPRGVHIVQKIQEGQYTLANYNKSERLQSLSNLFELRQNEEAKRDIQISGKTDKPLFNTASRSYYQQDFDEFSENMSKGLNQLWKDFSVYILAEELNKAVLAKANFKNLNDSLLIREAYKYRVSSAIGGNSEALQDFFNEHRANYYWSIPKFTGLVVFCRNNKVRKSLHRRLNSETLSDWKSIIDEEFNSSNLDVVYELGTFALGENPYIDYYVFKQGKRIRVKGYSRSRVYGEIIKGPDSMESVYDTVYADYSQYLEKEWEKNLLKAYKKGNLKLSF